jgi:hypothetical protein
MTDSNTADLAERQEREQAAFNAHMNRLSVGLEILVTAIKAMGEGGLSWGEIATTLRGAESELVRADQQRRCEEDPDEIPF